MKSLGWVSLLSVPVGAVLGLVMMSISGRGRDTSGFAGIGLAIEMMAVVGGASIIGVITGALALQSGAHVLPGAIGLIVGLIVVGFCAWAFLSQDKPVVPPCRNTRLPITGEEHAVASDPEIHPASCIAMLLRCHPSRRRRESSRPSRCC